MPQSNSYHDINGNPIGGDNSTPQSVQGYHDATGKPIHIDPSSGGLLQPPPGYAPDPSNSQLPGSSTEQIDPNTIAPFLGRFAANSLPMLGSYSPVPGGTALGRVAATGLQYASPGTFGEPPDSVVEFAKRLGVDYLTNVGIPKVIGAIPGAAKAVARSLPAVKEGTSNLLTKNILSQYSARPESALLEKAATEAGATEGNLQQGIKAAQQQPATLNTPSTLMPGTNIQTQVPYGTPGSVPHPSVVTAEKTLTEKFGENTTGKQLLRLKSAMDAGKDVASSQEFQPITNKLFSDLRNVQNAKLVMTPDTVAELGYKKLLGNEGPINASGILKEIGGRNAETWAEGLGQNLPAFKEAMGEIAKQQEKGPVGNLLNYAGHHLIWTGVAGGVTGLLSHSALPTAAAGGFIITNKVLSSIMKSQYAPVVVAALKATPGSPQAGVINQFMQAALKSVGAAAATAAYGK